jgi:radical SAM protein with 4Fe4S-binding SPASM domain
MTFTIDKRAFIEDCPANPLPHLLATHGKSISELKKHPLTVSVYLTRKCNLRCITCYISAGNPLRDELSINRWLEVIRKISDLGVEYVYLLGGEPTLLGKENLTKIIRETKEMGMKIGISTNGILLDRETVRAIKNAGIDQIQLSIDGSNAEINDKIRGKGSFEAAINASKNLNEEGIDFSTSMTLTSLNYFQSHDFIKLSEEIGAKAATILVAQPFGRAEYYNYIIPTKSQIQKAYELIKSYNSKINVVLNGFRFYLDDFVNIGLELMKSSKVESSFSICPAGRSRFVIDSNGDIYGCELLITPKFKEGNVLKDNLKDVWDRGFSIFRERDPIKIEDCKSCSIAKICASGCPARAYSFYGSINHKDPLCSYAQH